MGRIYLPPISGLMQSDYRWTAGDADSRSTAVATMLKSLQQTLGGPAVVMSKGVKGNAAGASSRVLGVKTGRRPDVQRRRGKQLQEAYGAIVDAQAATV